MGEWINQMRIPDEIRERERIEADSLADLVDFAIDTNNSVIEDDGYYVLHDGMLYTYDPPEETVSLSDHRLTRETSRSDGRSGPTDSERTVDTDD